MLLSRLIRLRSWWHPETGAEAGSWVPVLGTH